MKKTIIVILCILFASTEGKSIDITVPVIYSPTYVACFDKVPAAFEIAISPILGKDINIVGGNVFNANGDTVAKITCVPLDKMSEESEQAPAPDEKREWMATVNKILPPGKYKIEVWHKINWLSELASAELEIFQSSLLNEKEIDSLLTNQSYFGSSLKIAAQPSSGGKIKGDQFRIFLMTDNKEFKPPHQGLFIDEPFVFDTKANNVSLEITWIQPYTNKEIALFPKKSYEIKQKPPTIKSRDLRISSDSENGSKIRIIIHDIKILYPQIGQSGESNLKKTEIKISAKNQNLNIFGGKYEFSSEPQIETETKDKYLSVTLTTEISGSLGKDQNSIDGTISLELSASAINPINGKTSEPQTEVINVPVKLRIKSKRMPYKQK